jgi:hypothetical protein
MTSPYVRSISNSISFRARCLAALLLSLLVACAGGETGAPPRTATAATEDQLDGDPLALLPPGPILVVAIDARAVVDSRSLGSDIAVLADRLVPPGAEVGFSPLHDVDRIVLGSYSLEAADIVAVLRGRFDAAQIVRVAGGALVSTPYADRQIYTTGSFGFTLLTPRTALVGTVAGLHRALDRIHDARLKTELPPWMVDSLTAKDAAFGLGADLGGAPLSGLKGLPIPPWLAAIKTARAVGDLRDPGMNVAGTVTFDDPARAASGAEGMRQLGALVNAAALAGVAPQLRNLTLAAEGANVQVKFAVDDASLHAMLQQLPQYLGRAH